MKSLSWYVAVVQQKAAARFDRTDQLKSDSAERLQAWNRVIADHQKPLGPPKDPGNTTLAQL